MFECQRESFDEPRHVFLMDAWDCDSYPVRRLHRLKPTVTHLFITA